MTPELPRRHGDADAGSSNSELSCAIRFIRLHMDNQVGGIMPHFNESAPMDLRGLTWSRSAGSVNSDGAFLKAESPDKSLYFKLSSYNAAQGIYGHETINELLAYRVAAELGFPVPETELTKALVCIDGTEYETYVALSATYKLPEETRMSFENFYKSVRADNESAFSVAVRFGWEKQVYQMFLFDFLVFNRDRHGANLEVLDRYGVRRLSPLFDNGLSFAVSCYTDAELDKFDIHADRQVNNFIGSRSLYENIASMPSYISMNNPRPDFHDRLLAGLHNILSAKHKEVIWDLFSSRWAYVRRHILDNR